MRTRKRKGGENLKEGNQKKDRQEEKEGKEREKEESGVKGSDE